VTAERRPTPTEVARKSPRCRVVVTGGPGGGKTTAADLFRREIGERVVVVPEAATLLYAGGFPRTGDRAGRESTQRAIYAVQRNLEDVQSARFPERVLLCDRGTLDGAAYWPGAPADFFEAVGSTEAAELARYDAVIFFESAAVGGLSIEGGNPERTETIEEALRLDGKLRALWSRHPRFVLVRHDPSFMRKILTGLDALQRIVAGPR
jgi:predicted ATPase